MSQQLPNERQQVGAQRWSRRRHGCRWGGCCSTTCAALSSTPGMEHTQDERQKLRVGNEVGHLHVARDLLEVSQGRNLLLEGTLCHQLVNLGEEQFRLGVRAR